MIRKSYKGRINTYGSLLKFYNKEQLRDNYKTFYEFPNWSIKVLGNMDVTGVIEIYPCDNAEMWDCNVDEHIITIWVEDTAFFVSSRNNIIADSDLSFYADYDDGPVSYVDPELQSKFNELDGSELLRYVIDVDDVTYYSDWFMIDKSDGNNILIFWKHNKEVCDTDVALTQSLSLPNNSFVAKAIEISEEVTDRNIKGINQIANVQAETKAIIDLAIDFDDVNAIIYLCNSKEKELYIPKSGEWYFFENESWDVEFEAINSSRLKCNITITLNKSRLIGCSLNNL